MRVVYADNIQEKLDKAIMEAALQNKKIKVIYTTIKEFEELTDIMCPYLLGDSRTVMPWAHNGIGSAWYDGVRVATEIAERFTYKKETR
jgi:hypothetical protein